MEKHLADSTLSAQLHYLIPQQAAKKKGAVIGGQDLAVFFSCRTRHRQAPLASKKDFPLANTSSHCCPNQMEIVGTQGDFIRLLGWHSAN